ncbi:MAG: M12 family metallopeptidase [Bacteroidota bacterium]
MKWHLKERLYIVALVLVIIMSVAYCSPEMDSQQEQYIEEYVPPSTEFEAFDKSFNISFTLQDTSILSRDIIAKQIGELVILDGDMILGNVADMIGIKSTMISGPNKRWVGGIVPYTIEAGNRKRQVILEAIDHINSNTNVCLMERDEENDFVEFIMAGGCSSEVGRQEGKQVISVGRCQGMGNIVHEIGHTIGMFHEHARTDRDDHVIILESNIKEGEEENFQKYIDRGFNGQDLGKYDYRSIMHYGDRAFSIDRRRKKTILTKPRNIPIGQRDRLSVKDINAINSIYTKDACN